MQTQHKSTFQILLFDNFPAVNNENFSEFRKLLKSLWLDSGIQEAFERRAEYQLTDSMGYFYDHIDRISVADYVPTQQDILYCRKTTKGVHEFRLNISNVPFLFVDVGGQRTQRQKWLQCFDKVTAILFLASSSEFDQKLLEDKTMNRVEESRNIFDTIGKCLEFPANSKSFLKSRLSLIICKAIRSFCSFSLEIEYFNFSKNFSLKIYTNFSIRSQSTAKVR